jgi:hypothetical protein
LLFRALRGDIVGFHSKMMAHRSLSSENVSLLLQSGVSAREQAGAGRRG